MEVKDKRTVFHANIFDIEEMQIAIDSKSISHPCYRIVCSDWVNICAVSNDGRAIMIRQPRFGSLTYCLETPGGIVEPTERDTTRAAVRELEEETGFESTRILPLGSFNPNPAIMSNKIHFFLALNCQIKVNRDLFPDPDEKIKVELVPVSELDGLIRTGQIQHALSALCINLAAKYIPELRR